MQALASYVCYPQSLRAVERIPEEQWVLLGWEDGIQDIGVSRAFSQALSLSFSLLYSLSLSHLCALSLSVSLLLSHSWYFFNFAPFLCSYFCTLALSHLWSSFVFPFPFSLAPCNLLSISLACSSLTSLTPLFGNIFPVTTLSLYSSLSLSLFLWKYESVHQSIKIIFPSTCSMEFRPTAVHSGKGNLSAW